MKTIKAESELNLAQDKEEIAAIRRDLLLKSKQVKDYEMRCQSTVNESDNFRYRIQELQKENTELKL